MTKLLRTTLWTTMALAIGNPTVFAQEDTSAPLEEVIVTATRRAENLQDVPISVNVVAGETIQQGGFSDMDDLSSFVPNLYMSDGQGGQNMFIRGIGTGTFNAAGESGVAQFHDGVYYGRDNLGQNAFFDLERVEVVRGPQPLFAGQSATAGALRYISRGPGDEINGNVWLSYGSNQETNLEYAVGGPVSDTFGLRFAGRFYELGETGQIQVSTGDHLGTKNNAAARLLGVWSPSDNFELTFKYEYHDITEQASPREVTRCEQRQQFSIANPFFYRGLPAACAVDAAYFGQQIEGGSGSVASTNGGSHDIHEAIHALNIASGALPGDPNYWGGVDASGNPTGNTLRNANQLREFNMERDRTQLVDVAHISLDWDFGGLTLSSQTSLLAYDMEAWGGLNTSFAILAINPFEHFEQTAQEFSLSSPVDQPFSWMLGAYWQEHDMEVSSQSYFANQFGGRATLLLESAAWQSVYFSSTWNVSDALRLNLGARYQNTDKDGDVFALVARPNSAYTGFDPFVPNPGIPPLTGLNVQTDDVLPEVSAEWDIGQNTMIYVKYAEAFKAGGFLMAPALFGLPNPVSYKPEFAESLEAGLKSRLLDDTLELNLALYNTDVTDLQVLVFILTSNAAIIQNAAAVGSSGIEFDGRWAIGDSFSLGFNGSVGNGTIDDWPGVGCNALEIKESGLPGSRCGAQTNAAGQDLTFFPDWTFGLQPQYSFNVGANFNGTLSVQAIFGDGFPTEANRDPDSVVNRWERIDARLGIAPVAGNWEVALFGRNLTNDKKLYGATTNAGFVNRSLDRVFDGTGTIWGQKERYYGIQFNYGF